MNAVLTRLSVAIGGVLFVGVLVFGLTNGMPMIVAIFRASVVMCVSSTVLALFFRFFTSILHSFVAEQIMMKQLSVAAEKNSKSKSDS